MCAANEDLTRCKELHICSQYCLHAQSRVAAQREGASLIQELNKAVSSCQAAASLDTLPADSCVAASHQPEDQGVLQVTLKPEDLPDTSPDLPLQHPAHLVGFSLR